MTCVACGADASSEKLRKGDVSILQCGHCGLAFWQTPQGFRPESTYDAAYFSDAAAQHGYDDYASLESSLRRTFAKRVARIPGPAPGGRLLDIGAAFGFCVVEAAAAGWRPVGIEISLAAARRSARQAQGRSLVASALATPFAAQSFDAVTLWDVIEHLPDPNAALAEAARLLRPGATLALTTGDVGSWLARLSGARWHLYTLPEHLFFFSRRSLTLLLERHGFRVRSMRAEGAVYTLGYLAERLRKTLLAGSPRGPVRFPGSRLGVHVNLFDVLRVHAEKRAPGDPVAAAATREREHRAHATVP